MSLTPEERILLSPEEVLEGERASLITGMAIARAWRDPGYRDRLLSAPKEVLTEAGLEIPDSMQFRVFEDTADVKHVSITNWTSEPEELVPLFRELVPLPEGGEVRLIQNTEQALCLVLPLAPAEPVALTDVEKLRRLSPRASVFVSADDVVQSVAATFAEGESASASASATATASTETETATATATAWGSAVQTASGVVQASGSGSPLATIVESQGVSATIVLDGGVAIQTASAQVSGSATTAASGSATTLASGSAQAVTSGSASSMASGSAETAASGSATATASGSSSASVSTKTVQVTEASTFVVDQVSVVSEGASATVAVEVEAAATTTTVGAEAEVVAVGVIVVT